jgi:hypothetical protein
MCWVLDRVVVSGIWAVRRPAPVCQNLNNSAQANFPRVAAPLSVDGGNIAAMLVQCNRKYCIAQL